MSPEFIVRPTVYSLKGQALDLTPVELNGVSAETLDIGRLVGAGGDEFREGSLELRYVYEGCREVLSAGIVLEDAADRISYDELMMRPAELASSRLAGVWWAPSARSKMNLVLASRSSEAIEASVEVKSLGVPGERRNLQVRLGPHETRIVDLPNALTISGHGQREWAAGSINVRHSGKPGGLWARGMIEDRAIHYSSVVEFADPAAGKGSELHASGLRLGSAAGQPLYPMVVVYNAGGEKSTVTLRIPYGGNDGSTRVLTLDPIELAPEEVRELSPEVQRQTAGLNFDQVSSAGLEVVYSSASGTVLATAQSVSRDGDHVFRAPMTDPKTKGSAGNYPWKVDDTTSTFIYLKNVTNQKQQYTVQVDFKGGSYVLGLQDLAPHGTFALDLRALRDGGKADQHGTVIPADASGGQVHWSVIGPDGHAMIGRSEYVSQTHGIASTFACSNCCPGIFYRGFVSPGSGTIEVGESLEYTAFQQNKNCYGNVLGAYQLYTPSWDTNDHAIAVAESSGLVRAEAPGSTSAVACWTVYVYYWAGWDFGCVCSSHTECAGAGAMVVPKVTVNGPRGVPLGTVGNVNAVQLRADGTPPGGTYQWSIASGADKASFSATSSDTALVLSQAESAAENDLVVNVTYTVNAAISFPAILRMTVQKPTKIRAISMPPATSMNCASGEAGPYRHLTWQVLDRWGSPILASGMKVSDIITIGNDTCHSKIKVGETLTDPEGAWPDDYYLCATSCTGGNSCSTEASQVFTINGFVLSGDPISVTYTCKDITFNK